jgi:hypothetical protein
VKNIINFGTVSPGVLPSTGRLQSGNASFNGAFSAFTVVLNGPVAVAQYDVLALTGMANLTGIPTLHVQLNFNPSIGTQFIILTAPGGIIGEFKDPTVGPLGNGAQFTVGGFRFQINYSGSFVVLTCIASLTPRNAPTAPPGNGSGEAAAPTANAATAVPGALVRISIEGSEPFPMETERSESVLLPAGSAVEFAATVQQDTHSVAGLEFLSTPWQGRTRAPGRESATTLRVS